MQNQGLFKLPEKLMNVRGFLKTPRASIKRGIAFFLVMMISMSLMPGTPFAQKAAAAHWADQYISTIIRNGILDPGLMDASNPGRYITRAEFARMVNRAMGFTEAASRTTFKDVPITAWYAADIAIAFQQGYMTGTGNGTASPEATITRQEAVVMLCRALKIKGSLDEAFVFQDSKSFPSWSAPQIYAGVEKKFLNGIDMADGRYFMPTQTITLGEVAKILCDSVGTTHSTPGSLGNVFGNVTINRSGASLSNTRIQGDLYITEGVGLGYLSLSNVSVTGDVIISGAGEGNVGSNSIVAYNCSFPNLVIDNSKKIVSFKADGNTLITNAFIRSNTYLEELATSTAGFETVTIDKENVTLNLNGSFGKVWLMAPNTSANLQKGTVDMMVVDEKATNAKVLVNVNTRLRSLYLDTGTTLTGTGAIDFAVIAANGCKLSILPTKLSIRPGVTASIGNKIYTSTDADASSQSPGFSYGYPKIDTVTTTGLNVNYTTNKSGKVYWVVTLGNQYNLSAQDIKKPINPIKSGSTPTMTGQEQVVKVSGLKTATIYNLYSVFEDLNGRFSPVSYIPFQTVDNVLPAMLPGFPKMSANSQNSVTVSAATTKTCTYYWAIYNKGAVAPTAEALITGKLFGNLKQGTQAGGMNTATDIVVSGLDEFKEYDFYIVQKDLASNIGKVMKVATTTVDVTPPAFLVGYPKVDTITATAITMKYNVDENATMYWTVLQKGAEYPVAPPGVDLDSMGEEYKQELLKNSIISGSNAFKKGTMSATALKEGSFNIAGLAAQTPYDFYAVLKDKAGNISTPIQFKGANSIKTLDVIPPTAAVAANDVIDGDIVSSSELRIEFSEIVMDGETNKLLSELFTTSMNKNADFGRIIQLYHIPMQGNRVPVAIDFNKARVEDVGIKTYIVFPKTALIADRALVLNSGASYQFDLNAIKDTSGNRMNAKVSLPVFKTVPPLVNYLSMITPRDYHLSFETKMSEKNTSDDIYYDIILESTTTAKFKLYRQDFDSASGTWGAINQLHLNGSTSANDEFVVTENSPLTLAYLMNKQGPSATAYHFDMFNKLNDSRYFVKFTSVAGNTNPLSWSSTVTLTAKGVSGSYSALSNIAANPKGNLQTEINAGSASIVSFPSTFSMRTSFTDSVIPVFVDGSPMYNNHFIDVKKGDAALDFIFKTDKSATMYWLLVPKGTMTIMPDPYSIMDGSYKNITGAKTGTLSVPYGYTNTSLVIPELAPQSPYDVYYILKGTPPQPSDTQKITISTSAPVKANIEIESSDPGIGVNYITVKSDSPVNFYYMAYVTGTNFGAAGKPNGDMLKNKITPPYYVDAGNVLAADLTYDTSPANKMPYSYRIEVKNLTSESFYDFYVVAQKDLSSVYSDVLEKTRIAPRDTTPPSIVNATSTVFSNDPDVTFPKFSGTVSITFSESLYYMVNGAAVELTATDFIRNFTIPVGVTVDPSSFVFDTMTGPIKSVTFNYDGISHNNQLVFAPTICDNNPNSAGKLVLVFKINRDNILESGFEIKLEK